jgi:hypothetical protein
MRAPARLDATANRCAGPMASPCRHLIEDAVYEFDVHRAIMRPIGRADHFGPGAPSRPHPWALEPIRGLSLLLLPFSPLSIDPVLRLHRHSWIPQSRAWVAQFAGCHCASQRDAEDSCSDQRADGKLERRFSCAEHLGRDRDFNDHARLWAIPNFRSHRGSRGRPIA